MNMKTLSSIVAMGVTALMLTGCNNWWCCDDPCCDPCCDPCPKPVCCPQPKCCPCPHWCGEQPIDYCEPGYYPYFDPN